MTPYGFLAWVATQGIKHIPKKFLLQAFNSFKKLPSNQVILKTAKNLYDDVIKKTSTKDLTKQIRQKIKKDKPIIPKEFNKFEPYNKFEPKIVPKVVKPKIVKPKQLDKNFIRISKDQIDDVERSIANKPSHSSLKKSNVIPFPKKPLGKADGGSVDKALSGRSRDI